jgi:hypothetical protein
VQRADVAGGEESVVPLGGAILVGGRKVVSAGVNLDGDTCPRPPGIHHGDELSMRIK